MYKYEYDLKLMICDIYSILIFNSTIRQVVVIIIIIIIAKTSCFIVVIVSLTDETVVQFRLVKSID
jgi:hypothetical protein